MFVCLFSTEIQMAGQIGIKLGTEVVLKGWKVLGGFQPGTPHPRYRACKGGMGCLWRLNHAFWQKLYKTKVARGPQFSGCGSPFWTPNLDPEGPGPHVLLEP